MFTKIFSDTFSHLLQEVLVEAALINLIEPSIDIDHLLHIQHQLVLTGLYSQLDFASSLTSRWYCHKTEWWTDTAIHSISLKAKKEITPKKTGIYNRDWLSRLSTINLLNNMCWMYRNNKYLLCFLLRTVKKMHKYDIADCWMTADFTLYKPIGVGDGWGAPWDTRPTSCRSGKRTCFWGLDYLW